MYSDYHLHSHHSADSEESCEAIIKRCVELGMQSCCFTDHNDFNWPLPEFNFDLNIDEYFKELLSLQEEYKNKIQVNIGVECGIAPENSKVNESFISSHPFDFVIGSCHIVNGKDPYYPDFFEGKSDKVAFLEYFEALVKGFKEFKNFDVLGHLDYIVRYSPNKEKNYSATDYMDYIDYLLKESIALGKGIEINTNGLKSGLPFANPCLEILKRYKELGGEIITIGSDAHSIANIGYQFEKASAFLAAAGFKYYCQYKNRKPEFTNL